MCFLQDRGMPCFGRGEEKKGEEEEAACTDMLCHAEAIKRNVAFFLWFSRGSQRLFLAGFILCMVPGGDVNTLSNLCWEGEKKWRRGGGGGYTTGDVNNRTNQLCVCVSINLPLCMCACACVRGPLKCRVLFNPTIQESGEKTPKAPSDINLSVHPLCLSCWVR